MTLGTSVPLFFRIKIKLYNEENYSNVELIEGGINMENIKYTKMINVTTGEVVTLVESTYVDKLGFWSTIKLVRDKWGETPLWQYRYELRPAV